MTNLKFPLTLSCGCKALSNCRCWSERCNSGRVDGDSPIDRVLREFNGAWRQTLENYGCHLPSGRNHGPCPVCSGGKQNSDRFRFDDKGGRGTWFCSQCDPQSGGGLLLLSRFLGKPTIDVANELLGNTPERSRAPVYRSFVSEDQIRKANHEQARKGAEALLASSELRTHPYMSDRGLDGQWLVNGEPIMGKDRVVIQPGELMLVPAYKAEGDGSKLVNVQKIKANKEKRPLFGGDMSGVYHKLDGHQKLIAIAEGYATGVTVNQVTGAATYCAFNTGNLAAVSAWVAGQHPGVPVVFFADNDEHGAGLRYAKDAAAPIGATVALPPELGDWDDYRQAHGVEAAKLAMKSAIIADREACGVAVAKQAPVEPAPEPAPTTSTTPESAPVMPPPAPSAPPTPFGFTLPGMAPAPAAAPASKRKAAPKESDLPPGIDFTGMDIDTPPGLAGRIVEYIREGANRQLSGGAYSAMALQCMAMAAAGLPGLGGTKLSLITLTLGMSAAGKEWPQRVVKNLLDAHGKTIYGDIRSDKDVIRSAIYDNGHCFYVVDEAQKILSSNSGSQQNKHMSNVISTLMELSTTSCYKLSQLHRDEFLTHIETARARVEKVIEAKREAIAHMNQDHEEGRIKKAQLEIEQLERKLADHDKRAITARDGVRNPSLHLLAYSTPQKLAAIVDEDSIESGFLGRALINDCGIERAPQRLTIADLKKAPTGGQDMQFEMLKAQIGLICQLADDESKHSVDSEFNGSPFRYDITPDAERDMCAILQHYDQHHYRNHPRVGAIYARLVERVMSLSSIMALGNYGCDGARIESAYVRYALMLVLQSLEHLTSNLKINEGATEETIEAKLEAVQAAILKMINIDRRKDDQDGWRYVSVIKAQMKRRKFYQQIQKQLDGANQDAMQNALAMLGGKVEMDPSGKQIRLRK
ncbi:MAG: toprim domain-containing protein [Aeromonas popoffii]|uniref:toprim domain-containing protein n=1 Tax=Aeromonas popoffii TaxID=70856 RepID=UPI003F2E1994